MMRSLFYLLSALLVLGMALAGSAGAAEDNETQVLMETTMGNITIQLYDDMPITAGNFQDW